MNQMLKHGIVDDYCRQPTYSSPVLVDGGAEDEGEMNNLDLNKILWKCKQVLAS